MRWVVALAWLVAAASGWTFYRTASREVPDAPGPVALPQGAPIRSTPEPVSVASEPFMPAEGEQVEFERLAFDDYDPPDLRASAAPLRSSDFPAAARELDGRRLALVGFSQALQVADGAARQLLVARFPPGCCFGTVPVFDEWVLVEPAAPVDLVELATIVRVTGTLAVGESLLESGAVECLYRLTDAAVEEY